MRLWSWLGYSCHYCFFSFYSHYFLFLPPNCSQTSFFQGTKVLPNDILDNNCELFSGEHSAKNVFCVAVIDVSSSSQQRKFIMRKVQSKSKFFILHKFLWKTYIVPNSFWHKYVVLEILLDLKTNTGVFGFQSQIVVLERFLDSKQFPSLLLTQMWDFGLILSIAKRCGRSQNSSKMTFWNPQDFF